MRFFYFGCFAAIGVAFGLGGLWWGLLFALLSWATYFLIITSRLSRVRSVLAADYKFRLAWNEPVMSTLTEIVRRDWKAGLPFRPEDLATMLVAVVMRSTNTRGSSEADLDEMARFAEQAIETARALAESGRLHDSSLIQMMIEASGAIRRRGER